MKPKWGGDPLPEAPDCLAGERYKAQQYLVVLEQALDRPGWSSAQRKRIRDLYRKWLFRAEGRDSEFNRNGTFGRPPGSDPPTSTDLTVMKWRKLSPQTPEERRLRTFPRRFRSNYRQRQG